MEFASSLVPRYSAVPDPCSVFVPDFSVRLTTPPLVRPYCASVLAESTLNSSIASTGGAYDHEPVPEFDAPSIRNSLLPVRLPWIDTLPLTSHARVPEKPVAPKFCCVNRVPEVSCSSMYTCRPLSGSSDTFLLSIVCDRTDSFDSTSLKPAVTVTVSSTAPTSSLTAIVAVSAVCRTSPPRTNVLKPCSAAVSLYGPGTRSFTEKIPLASVTDSADTFVSVLTTATVTPGTTAPCVSVTVPVMLALNC